MEQILVIVAISQARQTAIRLTAVVEKVCLSTVIEQALVSPKTPTFGWMSKGKPARIPALGMVLSTVS